MSTANIFFTRINKWHESNALFMMITRRVAHIKKNVQYKWNPHLEFSMPAAAVANALYKCHELVCILSLVTVRGFHLLLSNATLGDRRSIDLTIGMVTRCSLLTG